MTQITSSEQSADPQGWVAMWRKAVQASGVAVALLELPTTRFLELSPATAQLLGTTAAEASALTYGSIAEQPREVAVTAHLVQVGMLDGVRAHARFRRPDGSSVDVVSVAWVIRSRTGREMGLWVVSAEGKDARSAHELSVSSPPDSRHEADTTWVTVDEHWRIVYVSRSTKTLLGRSPIELLGSSLIDLAHPDDMGILLLGLAQATTESDVHVRVRLRHRDGVWRSSPMWPTLLEGDGTLTFAVAIADDVAAVATPLASGQGVHLDLGTLLASVRFSERQWEIVLRLVHGERVHDIAAALNLSSSTVRNHLAVIYKKAGVHSKAELLATLLNTPIKS